MAVGLASEAPMSSWSCTRFACGVAVFSVASILSACATEDLRPRDLAASEDALIRGEYTYERPEVGSISGCTATLVGPRLVVTAAHCLGYGSRTSPGRYGTFEIRRRSGDAQRYTIERYVSYAGSVGADDVAIIRLASEVPADVATPARLASVNPSAGSSVTIYGYGCQRRGTSGSWAKQKVRVPWGRDSANLCPGDSGGPTMTDDGQVVRVNSGYWLDSEGLDIFGSVPRVYARIERTVAGWGDSLGGGSPLPIGTDAGAPDASRAPDAWTMSPPPPPPPPPGGDGPCAQATCAEATALPGCGWCDATGRGIRVGGMGEALEPCASGFRIDPADCGATERSTCGPWGDYPDYTCRRNRTQFVRCTEGGVPEFLTCPSGYLCNSGSTERRCYR